MHRRALLSAVFALAPALALASTNACSGRVDDDTGPADAAAGGKDVLQNFESGPKDDASRDAGPVLTKCCGAGCDEIDATKFPWKPPAVLPGSCSNEDLASFVAFVKSADDPQKWKDGAWTTNETCRSCVFGPETTTWPPLVVDSAGKLADLNVGGCIAVASGRDACGRAYQQWTACYLEACTGCPGMFSGCVSTANMHQCRKAFEAVVPSCGGREVAAAAEKACDFDEYRFEGTIRAQCIGLGDAGSDGGP